MRWHWIGDNPLSQAESPRSVKHDLHPPTPEQAAAILNAAFTDLPWGVLLWLAMTTGARRGELCALSWDLLDFDNAVLVIRSSIAQDGGDDLGEGHQDAPATPYRARRGHRVLAAGVPSAVRSGRLGCRRDYRTRRPRILTIG